MLGARGDGTQERQVEDWEVNYADELNERALQFEQ
jgi:hypothetical protein